MKKFFKILGIIFCIIFVGLYLSFLFVVPRVVDITQYKDQIKQIVKEQANIDIEYNNEKVITTPILGAGFSADDVKITLPDNTVIFSSDNIKATVSLPHLLLLTVRVSGIDIQNPFVNVEILPNGEDYKIIKHIENLLNAKKEATFAQKPVVEEKEGFQIDPNKIKIIIPNIRLHNYKVLINDLSSKHYLDLHGDKLHVGYFNGKSIRVRTIADLYSDNNKNISANIDLDTFLPPPAPGLDEEDDPAEKIDIPFINSVKTYQNYDLKANINSKIKIRKGRKGGYTSFGYFNIEDLTLRLSQIQLPKSYIKIKAYGSDADIDTNIYTTPNESISLLGNINFSKHPSMNINIKTSEIKFQNLLVLGKAFLDSLNIKNELNQFKASGSFMADCYIKTNFRKLKSNGFININNGALAVRNLGEVLSKVNVNIILDNNILDIVKSGLFIGNSEVKINGFIDEKSYTDINITTDSIPLSKLFRAFAPKDLRNSFDLKSGELSSSLNIKGKMKEAITNAQIKILNFAFNDNKNTINIKNEKFSTAVNFDAKTQNLTAAVENTGLKFNLPKNSSDITIPKLDIGIANKNIDIKENILTFNNNSSVKYSGNITNYETLESVNFDADGSIETSDLIKLLGSDLKPYINFKGKLPVKLSFNGDWKKKTLYAHALADANNYITPANFEDLMNKNTSLQATAVFKPNRIKIKDTGLFTRTVFYDEEGNAKISLGKIMNLDGTIEHNRINLMKFEIPKNLKGQIYLFPKSNFELNKAKIFAFGHLTSPIIRGDMNIHSLAIPEIKTALDNLNIKISEKELTFNLKDLMLKNSDISATGEYFITPAGDSEIRKLKVNSKFVNVDDLTSVLDLLNKNMPAPNSTKKSPSANNANIPVIIPDGQINFNRIITGNIELTNTISRMIIRKNILYLENLSTNIFKGTVTGNIDVNLLSMIINTNLSGQDINVEKALLDAAGMKDALSGKADFYAKLKIDGSATTQQAQMKGIEGNISFLVKNGQFGPFGRLENLIFAENIRESQFFQSALGGIINKISTIDTAHFSELKGKLHLKNGICNIEHITSQGNVMNLHILGKFDILKNYADMKVRVKITSIISNLLGPLNAINPVNLVNSAASMNVVTAKAFSIFCETVPENEFALLPQFENEYVDFSATKFQLGVRGDAAKPLTLIKSFKWLATQKDVEKAEDFINSIPEPIEGSTATTIEEVIQEAKAAEAQRQAEIEAEKKTLKYKLKHLFKKEKDKNNE